MMRWFQGSRVNENSKALAHNTEIENQLRLDSLRAKNEINMLLLGAGGSDQSTLLRQMKLLHYDGYSARERNAYKQIIFSNIIEVMRAIFEAMPRLDLELAPTNNARRAIILSLPAQIEAEVLPPDIADAIRGLWRDPAVKEAVRRSCRGEFQLSDDAVYYFNSIDRVAEAHYLPTDQDILRSRVKTTGITEVNFQIGELTYKVLDPSGQPSNRRKWIHCFESVKAILFCASLSDYDQFLDEDKSMNRLQESLVLFDSICNSRWFVKTDMILFLTNGDTFAEKLQRNPLADYFPDYTGGDNCDAAYDYLFQRFALLNQSATKQIRGHCPHPSDHQQLKFFLGAVTDILLQLHLRECGRL